MKKVAVFAVLGLMALASCSKSSESKGESASEEPQAKGAAKGQAEPAAKDEPGSKPKPAKKIEAKPASEEALGQVPEGYGVAVGSKAPDATVQDASGSNVRLSDLYSRGNSLVIFYRGGWCPFCNSQVRRLAKGVAAFADRGVTPVMISVDSIDEANKTKSAYEIPFPVLSDPDLKAHEAFRVIEEVPAADVERLAEMGMDLEKSSGRDHHKIAVPAAFLIDSKGVVRWAHVDRDYKVRPTNEQLLAVIDSAELQ